MFKFVPIVPSLVTGFHWQGPGSFIFIPSLQVLIYTDKIHLSISSLGWKVLALALSPAVKDPPSSCINFVVLHWICSSKSHSHYVPRLSDRHRNMTSWTAHLLNGAEFLILSWREILKSVWLKLLRVFKGTGSLSPVSGNFGYFRLMELFPFFFSHPVPGTYILVSHCWST